MGWCYTPASPSYCGINCGGLIRIVFGFEPLWAHCMWALKQGSIKGIAGGDMYCLVVLCSSSPFSVSARVTTCLVCDCIMLNKPPLGKKLCSFSIFPWSVCF